MGSSVKDQSSNFIPHIPIEQSFIQGKLKGGGSSSSPTDDTPSYMKDFQEQLKLQGFYLLEMMKDGNCLFRSFADQLVDNPEEHLNLRTTAANFLSDHIVRFSDFMALEPNMGPQDYINRISLNGAWGVSVGDPSFE